MADLVSPKANGDKIKSSTDAVVGLVFIALYASRRDSQVTNWQDRDASCWALLAKPSGQAPWII